MCNNLCMCWYKSYCIFLYNKISKEVEVKISEDYPMKIIYQLHGHDDAKIVFFLAPKISE